MKKILGRNRPSENPKRVSKSEREKKKTDLPPAHVGQKKNKIRKRGGGGNCYPKKVGPKQSMMVTLTVTCMTSSLCKRYQSTESNKVEKSRGGRRLRLES